MAAEHSGKDSQLCEWLPSTQARIHKLVNGRPSSQANFHKIFFTVQVGLQHSPFSESLSEHSGNRSEGSECKFSTQATVQKILNVSLALRRPFRRFWMHVQQSGSRSEGSECMPSSQTAVQKVRKACLAVKQPFRKFWKLARALRLTKVDYLQDED